MDQILCLVLLLLAWVGAEGEQQIQVALLAGQVGVLTDKTLLLVEMLLERRVKVT